MTKFLHATFQAHPNAIGETYWDHLTFALRFGSRLILAGSACCLHAICPALFQTTASIELRRLQDELARRSAR